MRNSSMFLDMIEPSLTAFTPCKCREPLPYLPQTSKESSNSPEQKVYFAQNAQINPQRNILEASCDMKGNKQKQIAYPHVNG